MNVQKIREMDTKVVDSFPHFFVLNTGSVQTRVMGMVKFPFLLGDLLAGGGGGGEME